MKKALKILLFTDACFLFAAGLIGPIYAIFVEEIGGDILDAGWAWAVFMLTSGIVIFVLSRWENKVQHYEQMVIGGSALRSIALFSYLFVGSPAQLFMAQALLGLGQAVTVPAYDTLFTKSLDKGKEASQWGNWESMYYIVTAVSAVAGSAIAATFGFKVLFAAMFGISIMGLITAIQLAARARQPVPAPVRAGRGK